MPFPAIDGGAQLMHFTTKGLLNNNVSVKVLAINPTRNYIDVNTLSEEYRNNTGLEAVTVDTGIRFMGAMVNLLGKESYFVERFVSKDFEQKLTEILQKESFDIIQLEHLYLCKYIPVIRAYSKSKIVLRAQNVEYVIWERYLKSVRNPFRKLFLSIAVRRLKRFEQSVNGSLDGIIALTKEDAELFRSFSDKASFGSFGQTSLKRHHKTSPEGPGKTPIIVVPMGYDYEKLAGYDFEKQFAGAPVVYHLGSMDWLPNVEAVKWFFENVLPVLEKDGGKDQSKVQISVAGRSMPSWVYRYKSDNISILGEITDPLVYQEDKPIMVVPLWSGSGIRAKIVEGLALGKVIIATTIGAQGIDYENGRNMLIADTPADFARQIIKCVESPDLCKEISLNARELSLSNYHYDSTAKSMISFYKRLLN